MRISDWSSDVCSSDLAGRRRRVPPGRGEAVRLGGALGLVQHRQHQIARLRRREDADEGGQQRLVAIAAAARLFGDRKSVGEGKSVSVRVVLGGRRIIKQKKTIYIKNIRENENI